MRTLEAQLPYSVPLLAACLSSYHLHKQTVRISFLLSHLPTWLAVCLSTHLSTYLSTCLLPYLFIRVCTYRQTGFS